MTRKARTIPVNSKNAAANALRMSSLRLDPERRDPPSCDDFGDEQAVRRYEREVRVHRAFTEPFVVTLLEHRVDGTYRVASASMTDYMVDIVDGSGRHDTCTCPDFLGNTLGTCKHLEAVRRMIASRPALRSAFARLAAEPAEAVLTVEASAGLRLRPLGPWSRAASEHRARILRARPPAGEGETFAAGRLPDGVRVVHAALPASARLRDRTRQERRRRALERAIQAGLVDPDVLRRPLFPYQREGVLHLVRRGRALLADDMGLGKTVQAIAACEVLRRRGEAQRILIVTAASLKHQWAQEIQRYAGEHAAVVGGGVRERRCAITSGAAYIILNYEQTWRELTAVRELSADVLILDEAQRAKNFRTKTAATLRAIPSRFLFILTGTPIENRLDDLYSLLQLVDPEILGPLWRYNLDFHDQNERGRITGYKNLSALRERIAPVVLRRRKEEVLLQLPPRIEQTRYTPLSPEQRELENGYRADAAKLLALAERRPLRKEEQERLMMFLLKARQACNALELCDPKRGKRASPKLDELEALVSEVTAQDSGKMLVFSEWVEMLKLASERLDRLGVGHAMLNGDVPTDRRPALLQRFRDDPAVRVLLSTDAGGVGLNLQVATSVVHLDLPWNPARLDQRTARAHRLGQTRGVVVTYLCAEEGIERGIEGTLGRKRAVRTAALEVTAQEDTIEAPSFSAFLRQMRDVLGEVAQPLALPAEAEHTQPLALPAEAEHAPEIAPPSEGAPVKVAVAESAPAREAPAQSRLRLARLVLDAGFFGDALRAAYEALAATIAGLGDATAPESHAALVALIYRDLLPNGKIPPPAHAALARLHDLTTLERSGVPVVSTLAQEAVAEAEAWVARLASTEECCGGPD